MTFGFIVCRFQNTYPEFLHVTYNSINWSYPQKMFGIEYENWPMSLRRKTAKIQQIGHENIGTSELRI